MAVESIQSVMLVHFLNKFILTSIVTLTTPDGNQILYCYARLEKPASQNTTPLIVSTGNLNTEENAQQSATSPDELLNVLKSAQLQ